MQQSLNFLSAYTTMYSLQYEIKITTIKTTFSPTDTSPATSLNFSSTFKKPLTLDLGEAHLNHQSNVQHNEGEDVQSIQSVSREGSHLPLDYHQQSQEDQEKEVLSRLVLL